MATCWQAMSLLAKEKLYLDCCASFNTEGEASPLSDDEFEAVRSCSCRLLQAFAVLCAVLSNTASVESP
eukprot:779260-Rhodomonas_salina.1